MNIVFKDISPGLFKAKVSEVKEEKGRYGPFVRITFSITEKGDLYHYRFSGIVKPSPLKQSKFFRWMKTILGKEPQKKFSTQYIIGKECLIYIDKHNNYYSVKEVRKIEV